MTEIDESKEYVKYAKAIVDGTIPSCSTIYAACCRFFDFFDRDDMYFDYEDVDHKIRFLSKLKHFVGQYDKQPFTLLPWQSWVLASVFGFKWKATNRRVTRRVFLFITRKNGKSSLISALAIALIMVDNEPGAEVDIVAPTTKQAHETFDKCVKYCKSVDPNRRVFLDTINKIKVPKNNSIIRVLSSQTASNDGYNSHAYIFDEFHAAKNWTLHDAMLNSQAMRQQPLGIIVTTAGNLIGEYPCYEYYKVCKDMVLGKIEDDFKTFAAIYELDEDDDWRDEKNWIKACPGIDVVVSRDTIRDIVHQAENIKATENECKTKQFNIFCKSTANWLSSSDVNNAWQDLDINQFYGCRCYVGADFSTKKDTTSIGFVFPKDPNRQILPNKIVIFSYSFVSKWALENSKNAHLYKKFVESGDLLVCDGDKETIDMEYISKFSIDKMRNLNVQLVLYDAWNADWWSQYIERHGYKMVTIRPSFTNFSEPTKDFECKMIDGEIVLARNSFLDWCFDNVELIVSNGAENNVRPTKKDKNENNKIDPIVAILHGYMKAYLEQNRRITITKV